MCVFLGVEICLVVGLASWRIMILLFICLANVCFVVCNCLCFTCLFALLWLICVVMVFVVFCWFVLRDFDFSL